MSKENPARLYLANLSSAESRRTQNNMLVCVAYYLGELSVDSFDWAGLTYAKVMNVREWASKRYAPSTVNKMLSAIRGVLHAAWRDGQMSVDTYHSAIDIKNVMHSDNIPGRMLDHNEVKALIQACEDGTVTGKRDKALLQVMLNAGLRRSEITPLTVGDYDAIARTLIVYYGKAHQKRVVYLSEVTAGSLAEWLLIQKGQPETVLFCSIRRGQHLTNHRMTAQAIYFILQGRAEAAGIKTITPHDMRRTFISTLLEKGVDLATVAQLAGHSDPKSTMQYDRRGDDRKRNAADLINFR